MARRELSAAVGGSGGKKPRSVRVVANALGPICNPAHCSASQWEPDCHKDTISKSEYSYPRGARAVRTSPRASSELRAVAVIPAAKALHSTQMLRVIIHMHGKPLDVHRNKMLMEHTVGGSVCDVEHMRVMALADPRCLGSWSMQPSEYLSEAQGDRDYALGDPSTDRRSLKHVRRSTAPSRKEDGLEFSKSYASQLNATPRGVSRAHKSQTPSMNQEASKEVVTSAKWPSRRAKYLPIPTALPTTRTVSVVWRCRDLRLRQLPGSVWMRVFKDTGVKEPRCYKHLIFQQPRTLINTPSALVFLRFTWFSPPPSPNFGIESGGQSGKVQGLLETIQFTPLIYSNGEYPTNPAHNNQFQRKWCSTVLIIRARNPDSSRSCLSQNCQGQSRSQLSLSSDRPPQDHSAAALAQYAYGFNAETWPAGTLVTFKRDRRKGGGMPRMMYIPPINSAERRENRDSARRGSDADAIQGFSESVRGRRPELERRPSLVVTTIDFLISLRSHEWSIESTESTIASGSFKGYESPQGNLASAKSKHGYPPRPVQPAAFKMPALIRASTPKLGREMPSGPCTQRKQIEATEIEQKYIEVYDYNEHLPSISSTNYKTHTAGGPQIRLVHPK
ncbi:hypothetical protein B0H17DRAFT_1264278 [Mycena rosella]|uniref:Uncharacterized protein n=1 Tax=Mycena rosella TaxID=1033263 RepID=A0AAD7H007_MYCRO|nr:hypothetical protein B0H17DRAFT_1264278 [Mycena rosella]